MHRRRKDWVRVLIVSIALGMPLCVLHAQQGVTVPPPCGPQDSPTVSAGESTGPSPSPGSLLSDLLVPDFSPFGFLLTYFPSELIGNGIEIKSYVRSSRFRDLRKNFGDLRAVDAIYIRALRLTDGNTGMALLYSSIAAMDHRIVGIKVPLLKLCLPLSNESEEEFCSRVANLPSHFYEDVPHNEAGDRDKLQHFFGSAFVAFTFESRGAAERIGNFIEWGEDAFIVDGAYDERDMRANRQGRELGLALLNAARAETGNPILPSDFLTAQIAQKPEPRERTIQPISCGAW